ncbi:MAG: hypothetical protein BGO55_08570 [Sphingobacteriales bacterium 50-39]|nr:hypothetical protein [Sphingobacteriales bacterium]OJW59317.1 MAG: hypothetical protein BGO55_08570 [Sphingobacteriales bacterium 50-39]
MIDLFISRLALMENQLYTAALQECVAQCFRQPGLATLITAPRYTQHAQWLKDILESVSFERWKEGSLAAGKEIYRLIR